tara:strand:+ start:758 stop:871 length:114 start_codon:yes stop_codon:yes gene_type:complete
MKVIKSIWSLLCDIGQAKYAADLARNGKIKEAQSLYR